MASNDLKKIVKEIQYKTNKTLAQIAKDLGYSTAYFTDQVNKGTNEALKELLLKKFGKVELQNGSAPVPDVDQFLVSKMLKSDAMQEVILSVLAELLSKQTGQPVTSVLSQLERSVADKQQRIKDELRTSE